MAIKKNINALKNDCLFSIGTMSGTSMDGIDVALIKTDGCFKIEEIGHVSINYAPEFHQLLKVAEYSICNHQGDISKAHDADFSKAFEEYFINVIKMPKTKALEQLQAASIYLHKDSNKPINLWQIIHHSTFLHELAIRKLIRTTSCYTQSIDLVGYHGQTLFHNPRKGITIQVGDSQELANRLKIMVVSDFRSRDVAWGGQGAPLAPLYHLALAARDNKLPLAVVNCGGIANISLILTANSKDLKGYDTGPGNGLIDLFVKQRTNFQENMDHNGKYGLNGKVHLDIIEKLYAKSILIQGTSYFDLLPPKSLDINNLKLIPELEELTIEDGCATLAAFTADSIIKNLDKFTDIQPKHWVLAGGGWYNPVIKRELEQRIKDKLGDDHTIHLAQEIGWNNKAIEAQIFAYLAVRVFKGMAISVPETTGVAKPITFAKLNVYDANNNITKITIHKSEQFQHYLAVNYTNLEKLLEQTDKKSDNYYKDIIIILNNIANIYRYLNKDYSTLVCYECALKIHQKIIYNNDIFSVVDNLIQLGTIYKNLGKYTPILEQYENAVDMLHEAFGDEYPQISQVFNKIGEIYHITGSYQIAIDYYYDALEIRQAIYGNNSTHVADSYDKIGNLYQSLNKYQLATQYYQNSLDILQQHYGDEAEATPDIADVLSKLATVYQSLGDYQSALNAYENILNIYYNIYGEYHLSVAQIYDNIRIIYQSLKYHTKILEYYEKAMVIYRYHDYNFREIYDNNVFSLVSNSFNVVAEYHENKGNYTLAMDYCHKSLKILQEIFSSDENLMMADIFKKIGGLYQKEGKYHRAVDYYQKYIQILQNIYDDILPVDAIKVLDEMRKLYQSLGECELTVEYCQIITYYKKTLNYKPIKNRLINKFEQLQLELQFNRIKIS